MSEPKKVESARELLGQLGEDYVRDEVLKRGPQGVVGGTSGAILLRELAQRGTVPGAAKRAVAAQALGRAGVKLAGRLAGPLAGAVLEVGRGAMKIMKPPSEEAFAEDERLGKELLSKPDWYQIGNLTVNTTEAFNQMRAAEARDTKEAFELDNNVFSGRAGLVTEVVPNEPKRDWANENRLADLEGMRRSVGMSEEEARRMAQEAFEEDNLEAISLEKVRNYLNATR